MRTFLALLMVLHVSGDNTTIKGVLGDSVLLPCRCKYDKDFQWQWNEKLVVFNETLSFMSNKSNRYTGRTTWETSRNNCSVLLANITAEDQGIYECCFHTNRIYEKSSVYLIVSASYSVCQKEDGVSGGVKVFQCKAGGRYREAWIQWTLDGQLLSNSATTNISHKNHTDAVKGIYNFSSKLRTNLNWTSEPMCDVKAINVSTILNYVCDGSAEPIREIPKRIRSIKVVPICLAVGLCLFLFYSISRGHK
ncbi:putative butyrophilin subfamily 2 member A3 [Pungitius pungitius]|uniref:putative butyrophilin subfamily 2 member A3 n=1 Tax=Pungitius pungitius TaxID=134920 RepID=UPI002E11ECEC